MMKFAQEICPEFDFVPQTFTLPSKTEALRLEEYMSKHKDATYIAKPQVGSQGDGMALFNELRDLPYGLDSKEVVV
jgi:hypothetical protein